MPTAEVKGCLVSVYHLAPQINEAFTVFLVAGANANKATSPDPSVWLCSVSLPISVFFTHSLHNVLRKGEGTAPKRRGLITCVLKWATPTANFLAQIILDPYRRPSLWPFCSSVQGGYSRIWCSNVCVTARFPRMLQKL